MQTRRETLKDSVAVTALLVSTSLFPSGVHAFDKAAFDTSSVTDAVKAFGGAAPIESRDVVIVAPDMADSGAIVPLVMSTSLLNVKRMLLLVDKNPSVLTAMFNLSPEVEAHFTMNAKFSQSSDVYAVAITHDGKTFFAKKNVQVTLGGCG